jgi:ribosomal protein L11 methylase PrmA
MTILFSAAFILFLFLFTFVVLFLKQGAQFVPSDDKSTQQIIGMVQKYKPKKILDLGSGDGKLVLAIGNEGFKIDGVEIDPVLGLHSRKAIRKAGLTKSHIYLGNMWTFDISEYDMIVVYIVERLIPRLEEKLRAEMKPGAYIVSNHCVFKDIPMIDKDCRAKVFKIQ